MLLTEGTFMALTIHGWPILEHGSKNLVTLPIPGVPDRKMTLRKDTAGYLLAFASEYHKKIAPLNKGTFDDWSWAPFRMGRASTHPSDHCAGMAIDLNATREGSQGSGSLTFWRNPVVRTKLALLRRKYKLLEWGGDYRTFRDPMHWTFKYGVTIGEIRAEMKRLGIDDRGL